MIMMYKFNIDGKEFTVKDVGMFEYNQLGNLGLKLSELMLQRLEPEKLDEESRKLYFATFKIARMKKMINPVPNEDDIDTIITIIDKLIFEINEQEKQARNLSNASQKKS